MRHAVVEIVHDHAPTAARALMAVMERLRVRVLCQRPRSRSELRRRHVDSQSERARLEPFARRIVDHGGTRLDDRGDVCAADLSCAPRGQRRGEQMRQRGCGIELALDGPVGQVKCRAELRRQVAQLEVTCSRRGAGQRLGHLARPVVRLCQYRRQRGLRPRDRTVRLDCARDERVRRSGVAFEAGSGVRHDTILTLSGTEFRR